MTEILFAGMDFGEGPRWHDGRLWVSDFHQHVVRSIAADGTAAVEAEVENQPSGLGWLPDGRLLVVSMLDRRVLRREPDGTLVTHADLSGIAPFHCNDMVVHPEGWAYVGNFGFDLEGGEPPSSTTVALVRPDGSAEVAADGLEFPNGSVITPDGSTLIVGESFGGRFSAFTIEADGTLTGRRTWAAMEGVFPDGCTLDAEGAIWVANAGATECVRVHEGGRISERVATRKPAFACMLGGDDGCTLFIVTAGGFGGENVGTASGQVETTRVEVPHAGWP